MCIRDRIGSGRVVAGRLRTEQLPELRVPTWTGVPGRQGRSARFDVHVLQSVWSAHRVGVVTFNDRWVPRETVRRRRQVEHPRRIRHFLQSDGTTGSRTIQCGTAVWREFIHQQSELQFAVFASIERSCCGAFHSEPVWRGNQTNSSDPVSGRCV